MSIRRQKMLDDILGIRLLDMKKAEELWGKLPAEVEMIEVESFEVGFDICGYILQIVWENFYNKHGVIIACPKCNFLASGFYLEDEDEKQVKRLAVEGCEIAKFILNN